MFSELGLLSKQSNYNLCFHPSEGIASMGYLGPCAQVGDGGWDFCSVLKIETSMCCCIAPSCAGGDTLAYPIVSNVAYSYVQVQFKKNL